ncbi:RDD family protein [Aridibaculum aurantiacum]|uniref:RDD family protein n=1 Tax=Aridibaculum aurantiacum TaxID=2810307 RepID=UPI001A95C546
MEDLRYSTGLKRFWAAIVDGIVFLPFILLGNWIFEEPRHIYSEFAWNAFLIFASSLYVTILHYKFGQTVGKWVVGIQVLDVGETRKLTLRQAVLRDIFAWILAITGTLYYGYLIFQNNREHSLINEYTEFGNTPLWIWTLLELLTMLTNRKRRALHDFIASSVVVRTSKP